MQVGAAVLIDGGRLLICRRAPHKQMGGLWEFPGGKLLPGERFIDAAVRECREEMGIPIELWSEITRTVHQCDDFLLEIAFFAGRALGPVERSTDHDRLLWVLPGELTKYKFCPADAGVVNQLMREGIPCRHKD